MKYFMPEYLPWGEEYMITLTKEVYDLFHRPTGSFNVLIARILGLSYADSLRYCQDYFNAKIANKEGLYCTMRFDSEDDCRRLCALLNSRWEQLLRRM